MTKVSHKYGSIVGGLLLLCGRSSSFLAGLTGMKSPADPIYLLVVPIITFLFGPSVFAIGGIKLGAETRANSRSSFTAVSA